MPKEHTVRDASARASDPTTKVLPAYQFQTPVRVEV